MRIEPQLSASGGCARDGMVIATQYEPFELSEADSFHVAPWKRPVFTAGSEALREALATGLASGKRLAIAAAAREHRLSTSIPIDDTAIAPAAVVVRHAHAPRLGRLGPAACGSRGWKMTTPSV
jgi:hypothetical protein